ncbi:hypothetical protein [Mycetocola spongiae]|uniref:hypothetical protein n=1 Tax=Mycetocola spongiae TaxID=2859226 RepID=UPI001CF288C3|nr:hypothetical protein [Mycetocola spongiae]UCR89658.1 hypothetical protein KXZ72_02925 [Mycetocola spongiae]
MHDTNIALMVIALGCLFLVFAVSCFIGAVALTRTQPQTVHAQDVYAPRPGQRREEPVEGGTLPIIILGLGLAVAGVLILVFGWSGPGVYAPIAVLGGVWLVLGILFLTHHAGPVAKAGIAGR